MPLTISRPASTARPKADDDAINLRDPRLTPEVRMILQRLWLLKMRYLSQGKGQKYHAICTARLAIWHGVIGARLDVLLDETRPAPLDLLLP